MLQDLMRAASHDTTALPASYIEALFSGPETGLAPNGGYPKPALTE